MLGTGPDSVAVLRKRGNPGTRRLEDGLRGDGLSKQGEKIDICSSLHIFFFFGKNQPCELHKFCSSSVFVRACGIHVCMCLCVHMCVSVASLRL